MSNKQIDFKEYYDNYLNNLIRKVKSEVKQAMDRTWSDFFIVVDEKIREIFNSAIQDFYDDYTPEHYERNQSLFELLQVQTSKDSLSIWFDPSKMTSFRSGYNGEDGLYDQVFRKGWHGGAASGKSHPSPTTPYWRTPIPYYTNWGSKATFAPISPLDNIKRSVADYEKHEMQIDFNRIWTIHVNNIKID